MAAMSRRQCGDCGAVVPNPVPPATSFTCSKCGTEWEAPAMGPRHPLAIVARRTTEATEARGRLRAAMLHAQDMGCSARDVARAAGVAHSTVARLFAEQSP